MGSVGKAVLVADDRATCDLIRVVLESELGVRMVLAEDGREALRQASEMVPAVVLLELELPVLDGREVARQLKAGPTTRNCAIIALTSVPRADEEARAAGCDDVLDKPFDIDVLVDKVRQHLR